MTLVCVVVVISFVLFAFILHQRLPSPTTTTSESRVPRPTTLPMLGLGTASMHGEAVCAVVVAALDAGITLIDTAAQKAVWYRNEAEVGRCLADLQRSVFVTTKLHPVDHGTHSAVAALRSSLRNLRREHIDLLLFHYAECWGDVCGGASSEGSFVDSYRALAPFVHNGTVRALGVSNFQIAQLDQLRALSPQAVAVVQDWFDPFHQARELRAYCAHHGIAFQAYSPLGGQVSSRWIRCVLG